MLCFCTWHIVILMWFSIMAGKLVLNKSLTHYVRPRPNVETNQTLPKFGISHEKFDFFLQGMFVTL